MGDEASWVSTSLPGGGAGRSDQHSLTGPQTARAYDYYLGGKDNFEDDRVLAEKVLTEVPNVALFAKSNRHFANLVTDYLARRGVRQYLDIGTGIPTEPNTHQIVQHYHGAQSRILYVDHDPIVLTYAEALMQRTHVGRIDYIEADLRRPQDILNHRCIRGEQPVFDLNEPVAVFLVAILHFIEDKDNPLQILKTILDALPSGSFLVMTHVTPEWDDWSAAVNFYREKGLPVQLRTKNTLQKWIDELSLQLAEPGVVPVTHWWPDGAPAPFPLFTKAEASCNGLLAQKP